MVISPKASLTLSSLTLCRGQIPNPRHADAMIFYVYMYAHVADIHKVVCKVDGTHSLFFLLFTTPASHFSCFHDDHCLPKVVRAEGHSCWLAVALCGHQWGQQRQVVGELVRDEVLRLADQHTYAHAGN